MQYYSLRVSSTCANITIFTRGRPFHCNYVELPTFTQCSLSLKGVQYYHYIIPLHRHQNRISSIYAVTSFESSTYYLPWRACSSKCLQRCLCERVQICLERVQVPFGAIAFWLKQKPFYVCSIPLKKYAIPWRLRGTHHGLFPSIWVNHLMENSAILLSGNESCPFKKQVSLQKMEGWIVSKGMSMG